MNLIGYFTRVKLIPKNGETPINEFFDDPGFIKKIELSRDGTKIIVTRLCPNGHPKPTEISAINYFCEVSGRRAPQK